MQHLSLLPLPLHIPQSSMPLGQPASITKQKAGDAPNFVPNDLSDADYAASSDEGTHSYASSRRSANHLPPHLLEQGPPPPQGLPPPPPRQCQAPPFVISRAARVRHQTIFGKKGTAAAYSLWAVASGARVIPYSFGVSILGHIGNLFDAIVTNRSKRFATKDYHEFQTLYAQQVQSLVELRSEMEGCVLEGLPKDDPKVYQLECWLKIAQYNLKLLESLLGAYEKNYVRPTKRETLVHARQQQQKLADLQVQREKNRMQARKLSAQAGSIRELQALSPLLGDRALLKEHLLVEFDALEVERDEQAAKAQGIYIPSIEAAEKRLTENQ